jgi:hypothetical protein
MCNRIVSFKQAFLLGVPGRYFSRDMSTSLTPPPNLLPSLRPGRESQEGKGNPEKGL